MKNIIKLFGICMIFLISLLISVNANSDENIVFLHHSVGGNLYDYLNKGIDQYFVEYNALEGTSYSIEEWEYPGERDYTPYPWNNYPWDYWNLWINPNTPCNSNVCSGEGYRCMECIDPIINQYDVVVLKHCYAGSDILENTGNANVMFSTKSIENYELQYAALRDLFDSYPNTLFIVFTLPPRDKDSTSADIGNAARATQFSEWTKNNWLNNGNLHNNIVVFDIREYLVEKDSNSAYFNFLKEEYVSVVTNSHPNDRANNDIGPIFGEFLINETQKFFDSPPQGNPECGDNECNGDENCLTCSEDCGLCLDSQIINLNEGWNVVSMTIDSGITSNQLEGVVMDYDGGIWNSDFPNVNGDEFLLEPLKGYFVYSNIETSLEFDGVELSSDYNYPLVAGWNLISVNQAGLFLDIYSHSITQENIYSINPNNPTLIESFDPSNNLVQENFYWINEGSRSKSSVVSFFDWIANFFKSLFS